MKLKWILRISSVCFCLCLIRITDSSASIHFDKVVLGHNHDNERNPFEKSNGKPISSSSTVSIKQNKIQKLPLNNRPRRDHQYATYKVPKNHVLLDYGGWNPRQLTSFASTNPLGAGGPQNPPPNEYPYPAAGNMGGVTVTEEDNEVAAGGHGHSHHGWGWGHGHGHHKYKKSEVNSSAVGMLGFLGLLALVQNVLRQMNNNAGALPALPAVPGVPAIPGVPGKRRRRSMTDLEISSSKLQDTTAAVIPYLLNLNQIRQGELSPECTSYQVCMLSQTASQGMTGESEKQVIKKALISFIGEMLTLLTQPTKKEKENLKKTIGWAANFGLKGEKCDKHFKECKM